MYLMTNNKRYPMIIYLHINILYMKNLDQIEQAEIQANILQVLRRKKYVRDFHFVNYLE